MIFTSMKTQILVIDEVFWVVNQLIIKVLVFKDINNDEFNKTVKRFYIYKYSISHNRNNIS